jgi:hypothetical protein
MKKLSLFFISCTFAGFILFFLPNIKNILQEIAALEIIDKLPPPSAGTTTAQPKAADKQIYTAYPQDYSAFASPGLPPDSTYLLNRNYLWQGLYSPRWQLFSGKALRVKLAAAKSADAKRAFMALKVGSDAIAADGSIPFKLPSSITGNDIKEDVVAQAGSFYLGEACLAMEALSQYSSTFVSTVASKNQISVVKGALNRGYIWLKTQDNILRAADIDSPNRLFFDALAFSACGHLFGDNSALNLVESYIAYAAELAHIEGYFIEKGGWDTHYQSVAINQGNDLLLSGYNGAQKILLSDILYQGAKWLAARVDSAGIVHSEGNTRTCWSGETILNSEKMVDPREIWRALQYTGVMRKDASLQKAASRVADWIRTNPETYCVL